MVETDWKEILNYSQKELKQADKEKLCESLSWMEADDIELNFSDLKTLFRLAQDILKFKSEQVNSLLGQLETLKRRYGKAKEKNVLMDSPAKNSDTLETMSHQEELIKANKEILEQLYSEIAELENRKSNRRHVDIDSESSRDALSEMSAVAKLENEVLKKNRHIRKLLSDVKTLEEENTTFKQKLSVFKDKLKESTQVIENLTEQLFSVNSECAQLKAALGKCEEDKAQCKVEIETLGERLHEKKSIKETVPDTAKLKLQQSKEIIKVQQNEINRLSSENMNHVEEITRLKNISSNCNQHNDYEIKIKVLQDDLAEASRQMIETAELISNLKMENNYLKKVKVHTQDRFDLEQKNEYSGRKEKNIIKSLQKNITRLTCALHGAEEMIALREKELTEIATQLQLLQTDDSIRSLLIGLKNKKRQMKLKDEGIKYLVAEVNSLHQLVNELQIENIIMRQQLKIPENEKVNNTRFLKEYYDIKQKIVKMTQKLKEKENKLVKLEVEQHYKDKKILKLGDLLRSLGYTNDKIDLIVNDEKGDTEREQEIQNNIMKTSDIQKDSVINIAADEQIVSDYKVILEENEGLRSSLTDILNCLKDNSTTTSGVLTLECPSLDTVLQSMEARRAAGWFAPHMKTVLELRAALGGKDALLTALHESRKETFEVMKQLSQETKKGTELEKVLNELKSGAIIENCNDDKENNSFNFSTGELGSWILESDYNNIDVFDKKQLEDIVTKGDTIYENHIKQCLLYFQNKFKILYDKLTFLSIRALDDKDSWSIKEEQYKAEIENLKTKIGEIYDEDISEQSPGLIESSSKFAINSKCNILQENYKNIKTLNENLKNEYLDCRKESLIMTSEYERKVQNLMITVINLSDKLRNSIPIDLFWQQNSILHDYTLKYRNILENNTSADVKTKDLMTQLNKDKTDIINYFRSYFKADGNNEHSHNRLTKLENSIVQNQLVLLSGELDSKTKEIEHLKTIIADLQKTQNEFINKLSRMVTDEEIAFMKENIEKITDENKALKENCQGLNSELEIVSTQLQAYSQKELSNEVEVDLLRHQILDLQSTGKNNVLISRLSNEILMAHLQASESLQKMTTLKISLNKEKQLRLDAEDMLQKQQNFFDIYVTRNNIKFRNIFEIMEILRQQYQGILPLISLEKYSYHANSTLNKNIEIKKKLNELEDVRNTLMTKHTVFDQILNLSNLKCFDEQDSCPHKIKCIMMEKMKTMELDHYNKRIETTEQACQSLLQKYKNLEKTLLLVNQCFKTSAVMTNINTLCNSMNGDSVEIEDVKSDTETNKTGNETYTLSSKTHQAQSPTELPIEKDNPIEMKSAQTQTKIDKKENKGTQSEEFLDVKQLKKYIETLNNDKKKQDKILNEILLSNKEQAQLIDHLNSNKFQLKNENTELEKKIQNLMESNKHKDMLYENLQTTTDSLKGQLNDLKNNHISQVRWQDETSVENKSLLLTIKKIENDKKYIIEEYKKLFNSEREEFARSINAFQSKLGALQSQLDQNGSKIQVSNEPQLKESEELNSKINELEDKCFKLNTDLETCESDLKTCKSELERWKNLASERLKKMEQSSTQLKERYSQEVESYKVENDHWLVQLNETQREHLELRTRLTEQKTLHVKQLADKDTLIEHLRSVINNLKTQIMNMQTMISLNDPSFDLSAIVEVEEASDAVSHQDSDRLELKFESTGDLNDLQDDMMKFASSSTVIWQEPLIERLRREKQLMSKQNAILRKQIKALAGRERRARLDAQNLKNQVFRISTSGHKVPSAESAALQNKIASLQAQLTNARREAHSTVALWDKWKRAQQSSERWQARYEEKCQEVIKLESSLTLAKSAVQRLEKEKRVLLSRLSEEKSVKHLAIEKHDAEPSEKSTLVRHEYWESPPPLSTRTLLERVEAQQRRIVALELAEKGNEPLVSEYEKSLAEITSLKGQVLKLESALLEAQIKSPLRSSRDNNQSDLDYWKSYCDMLKEENMQLTLRVSSLESTSSPMPHQRVNDLEQTVLTLRGLVSKLQAEQKSANAGHRRPDSRPASGRSITDKSRNTNIEMYRTEITNLKRSIQEKDLLLERSKEMLKIAAEREEDLLRENMMLRRRLEQVSEDKGFLSA